jgi:4-hydroxy-4-methyl-2-oxoglutarate aldolase
VFREVDRPDREIVERFRSVPTADLADVMHKRGSVDPAIRPVFLPIPKVVGPAVTVSVPDGAFEVIKIALEMTKPGDVVVINARGITDQALLGGNVCRGLKMRGVAGLVADGAVRDVVEIREDGLPVFARGVALHMVPIEGAGEVNVPVAFGGVVVNPGDIVVADEDGIMIVPPDRAEEILSAADALDRKHQAAQPELLAGKVAGIGPIIERVTARGATFFDRAHGAGTTKGT